MLSAPPSTKRQLRLGLQGPVVRQFLVLFDACGPIPVKVRQQLRGFHFALDKSGFRVGDGFAAVLLDPGAFVTQGGQLQQDKPMSATNRLPEEFSSRCGIFRVSVIPRVASQSLFQRAHHVAASHGLVDPGTRLLLVFPNPHAPVEEHRHVDHGVDVAPFGAFFGERQGHAGVQLRASSDRIEIAGVLIARRQPKFGGLLVARERLLVVLASLIGLAHVIERLRAFRLGRPRKPIPA
ncbi:MAG: hypothetical protein M5U26_23060 [Planctomycetota bacterium]|nr:hypothetical protein [Planctomycetota bacterium]